MKARDQSSSGAALSTEEIFELSVVRIFVQTLTPHSVNAIFSRHQPDLLDFDKYSGHGAAWCFLEKRIGLRIGHEVEGFRNFHNGPGVDREFHQNTEPERYFYAVVKIVDIRGNSGTGLHVDLYWTAIRRTRSDGLLDILLVTNYNVVDFFRYSRVSLCFGV